MISYYTQPFDLFGGGDKLIRSQHDLPPAPHISGAWQFLFQLGKSHFFGCHRMKLQSLNNIDGHFRPVKELLKLAFQRSSPDRWELQQILVPWNFAKWPFFTAKGTSSGTNFPGRILGGTKILWSLDVRDFSVISPIAMRSSHHDSSVQTCSQLGNSFWKIYEFSCFCWGHPTIKHFCSFTLLPKRNGATSILSRKKVFHPNFKTQIANICGKLWGRQVAAGGGRVAGWAWQVRETEMMGVCGWPFLKKNMEQLSNPMWSKFRGCKSSTPLLFWWTWGSVKNDWRCVYCSSVTSSFEMSSHALFEHLKSFLTVSLLLSTFHFRPFDFLLLSLCFYHLPSLVFKFPPELSPRKHIPLHHLWFMIIYIALPKFNSSPLRKMMVFQSSPFGVRS